MNNDHDLQHPSPKIQVKSTEILPASTDISYLISVLSTSSASASNIGPTTTTVRRTHSEIERLYAYMKLAVPGAICAAPPPGIPSKQADVDISFIGRRMETFLNRVFNNKTLYTDKGVRLFFESEFQYVAPSPPSIRKLAPASRGFFSSLIPSTSSTFSGVKDPDPEMESAKDICTRQVAALNTISKLLDKMGKAEKSCSSAYAEVGGNLLLLSSESTSGNFLFTNLIKKLVKTFKILESQSTTNSHHTCSVTCDDFVYVRQNIESALSSQFTRLDLLSDYDTAYKSTQKCVTVLERLKTRSNIETDKVDAATHSLVEAKKLEVEAKEVYEAVSIQLKEEYNTRFSGRVMHDMVETMDEYVSVQIESAKNLVNAIEILNRDMTSL